MSLSRRDLMSEAPILGLLAAMAPELSAARAEVPQVSIEDAPHDSYSFWNGFFDSVNPDIQSSGQKAATRGPTDQLPDPGVQTQYLHYKSDEKKLRYATEIGKEELLDHEGDVAVGISLSQYRPAIGSTTSSTSCETSTISARPLVSQDRPSGAGNEQDSAHKGCWQDSC